MTAKRFIVAFLLAVAAIAAVSIYVSVAIDKIEKTIAAIPSPDGKYKTVRITMRRGGAQPFCFDSVSVVFAIYPDDFAERDKAYEVFSAPCGRFADGEPSPKIEWLTATDLQIAYMAAPAATGARKTAMKPIDVTKTVHVKFVAQP